MISDAMIKEVNDRLKDERVLLIRADFIEQLIISLHAIIDSLPDDDLKEGE